MHKVEAHPHGIGMEESKPFLSQRTSKYPNTFVEISRRAFVSIVFHHKTPLSTRIPLTTDNVIRAPSKGLRKQNMPKLHADVGTPSNSFVRTKIPRSFCKNMSSYLTKHRCSRLVKRLIKVVVKAWMSCIPY
jgi:hypothetical protein